jgi:cysteine desulfurase
MMPFFSEIWGSPSSPHLGGQEPMPAITESYKAIYELLGAKEVDDFIFTSSGAEAVNQVILAAYFDQAMVNGKNQLITSHIDEAPAIMAIGRLEKLECVGKMVNPNSDGKITAHILSEAISPRTAMISLSLANGLTGVINPVEEIVALCKERGIALHLDVTHVLGKHYMEVGELGADFITFNGEQFHAPKGTGGLWIRSGKKCSPFILGGIEQGGGRGGSYNVPGLIALGQAAREAVDNRDLLCSEVARLRDKLEMGIVSHYPAAVPFYTDQERLPHCAVIAFPGIPNETMLHALNRKGVLASIGGGSFQQIGLLLAAAGVPDILAHTAVGFSLSRETHEDEIDRAVEIIANAAKSLRNLSSGIV